LEGFVTAKLRGIVGSVIVAMAIGVVAQGQANGTVEGIVSGPNGGLPDLVVNIINVDTGAVISTTKTASNGAYSVANLPPGNYTVQVANSSGSILSTRNVLVGAGVAATVNIVLTASQMAAAGLAAGGAVVAAGGGLSTAAVLGIAGVAAAGIGTTVALTNDPSPNQ
jgi:hypothetical protein